MSKQDKKLLKNIEQYEKEKAKQQESKILGQKQVKQTEGNAKTRMHN